MKMHKHTLSKTNHGMTLSNGDKDYYCTECEECCLTIREDGKKIYWKKNIKNIIEVENTW